jgi:hypothetical protein
MGKTNRPEPLVSALRTTLPVSSMRETNAPARGVPDSAAVTRTATDCAVAADGNQKKIVPKTASERTLMVLPATLDVP